MELLTSFQFAVVYPQQTVRGGEVLLIEDRDVMVLHSFVVEYHPLFETLGRVGLDNGYSKSQG